MVRPGFLIALAAVLALAWYLQTDAGQQRFVGFLNALSQEQQAPLPQISTDFAPITGGTDTTKLSMQTGHYVDVQKAVVEQLGAIEKACMSTYRITVRSSTAIMRIRLPICLLK